MRFVRFAIFTFLFVLAAMAQSDRGTINTISKSAGAGSRLQSGPRVNRSV
jgi:hypothetical protein